MNVYKSMDDVDKALTIMYRELMHLYNYDTKDLSKAVEVSKYLSERKKLLRRVVNAL